jgi:transcriptional regulator with XRE-family HTH domain
MVVPMTAKTAESPMKKARLGLRLTHRELADRCRAAGVPVDHSQLVRIENGQSSPRMKLRGVLADALGIREDQLP